MYPAWHVCIVLLVIYTEYPEGARPLWASWQSPFVSRKSVPGDQKSNALIKKNRDLREAYLQESVRRKTNFIWGIVLWMSNHIFVKSVANKYCYVDAAAIDSRKSALPWEISISERLSKSHLVPMFHLGTRGAYLNILSLCFSSNRNSSGRTIASIIDSSQFTLDSLYLGMRNR